jgi:lipoprotein-anchoring transpeptidase ErfK/SrfK
MAVMKDRLMLPGCNAFPATGGTLCNAWRFALMGSVRGFDRIASATNRGRAVSLLQGTAKGLCWTALALVLACGPARSASIDAQAINDAQWSGKRPERNGISPEMVKLQVMLDRAHFSPGEIDGKSGENVDKAIAAYAAAHDAGLRMTAELWQSLTEASQDPAIIEHKLSEADVKGPFAEKIPAKMEDMKDLKTLAYTSPKEKLAEQFHMSPQLLVVLNPGQSFEKPGDTILVANVSGDDLKKKAARIEIDKSKQVLKIFDKSETLAAVYPVTAGSTEKPAPDGVLKVQSVTKNPTYRYNPDYAFKGVKSQKPFTIKPGPNNPVGLVWIGLNKEGYGIHGTPEPSKVSKSESHGCIRLTNWDALQLASIVNKGVPVEFSGDERERVSRTQPHRTAKPRRR